MQKLNSQLVTAIEGEARASSEVIAHGTGIQHKNAMALVRKHIADLSEFGMVAFQTRARSKGRHGGGDVEFALLNEPQASLLILMMRNAPQAVSFKKTLVREFFRMRDELQNREKNLWQQMQALIAVEVESKVRASFGSHLMLERKREIPFFYQEHARLENMIQPSLIN